MHTLFVLRSSTVHLSNNSSAVHAVEPAEGSTATLVTLGVARALVASPSPFVGMQYQFTTAYDGVRVTYRSVSDISVSLLFPFCTDASCVQSLAQGYLYLVVYICANNYAVQVIVFEPTSSKVARTFI